MTKAVEILAHDDGLLIVGDDIGSDRRARLFLRGILGAQRVSEGWLCPLRRTPERALALRLFDWFSNRGYEVTAGSGLDVILGTELERRRSFERTRESASNLRAGASFDFSAVQATLDGFGWSQERALRLHQKYGVSHALTAINAANFSVPGSGKTVVALAVAATHLVHNVIDVVVVVGPLACFAPWESEARAALIEKVKTVRARGTSRKRQALYARVTSATVVLVSYATAAADQRALIDLFARFRVMLVVDESHRVKRFRGGLWAPALMELARRARIRMVLSGTPMPQSGRDLYSQLNILWPDEMLTGSRDEFARWVSENFNHMLNRVGPFVSRTPKSALGLPGYTTIRHEVELRGLQAEIYQLVENGFREILDQANSYKDKIEALRRARPIRLLQAAANPDLLNRADKYYRIPRIETSATTLMERLESYREVETPAKSAAALELIQDAVQRGRKVVCWSNFVGNLDALSQLVRSNLSVACYQIDGRVPAGLDALRVDSYPSAEWPGDVDTRESVIERFLKPGEPAVLVTNPASCSESISLHTTCHTAIYLDRTYDCAQFLQSIDRVHRLGLPENANVEIHILLAQIFGRSTIDAAVDVALQRKELVMRQLLESAELAPLNLSEDPAVDAGGERVDLEALLRFLLGQGD